MVVPLKFCQYPSISSEDGVENTTGCLSTAVDGQRTITNAHHEHVSLRNLSPDLTPEAGTVSPNKEYKVVLTKGEGFHVKNECFTNMYPQNKI